MGIAPNTIERYTDDATAEHDALSLHTNPAEQGDSGLAAETLAVPPPYSDNDQDASDGVTFNSHAVPIAGQLVTHSNGSVCVWNECYDIDPEFLDAAVRRWAAVPPVKTIEIKGTHTQTTKSSNNKTEKETIVDFHLKLRLTEYLFTHPGRSAWHELDLVDNGSKTYRGTVFRTNGERVSADLERAKPTLKEWCHRYCANHSKLKTSVLATIGCCWIMADKIRFKLTRVVRGLDEEYLSRELTSLIRNTNYRGHMDISFPIENPSIEVYSDHRVNRWRHKTWIYLLFLITFLWIFSWPILFFLTKKYSVVKSVWSFSKEGEDGRRVYATLSETQWYNRWRKTIEMAVIQKRQGTITEEDLARADEQTAEVNSGNQIIDQAVGILGAGVRAYHEVNRQVGWGFDC
jgi:hypothetical protein